MKKNTSLRKFELSFLDWFRKVLAHKLLVIISKENYKLRGNIQMAVFANDFVSNHVVIDGFYEKLLLDNIMFFLGSLKENTENWCFFDIGANIGNHSIYFADHVKEVHSFEPNPTVFKILQINSGFKKNINCYNFGLGEKKDKYNLNLNQENIAASFVDEENKNKDNIQDSISINIDTLDNLLENFNKVDLVKIDVEGFEENVLKGGKKFFKKFKPIILFEQLAELDKEKDLNIVSNLLLKQGYELYTFSYPIRNKNFLNRKLNNIKEIIFNKKIIEVDLVKITEITKEMIFSGQGQLILALPERLKKKIPND
ncbi:FkbM family methyltransferase [Prochlorococcus marinus XMU1410]|uniref:FkbM family methyltransferase n=1 Tax=Prochlorococcus marinus TaxID=1219 RepID=UPI001ADD44C7|nr:FkbM family methyltransferase [Prochlorococcus marinus]MBO8242381.1 FkbM family methyltransferase [Prochlorococcus marinus XMU1410]MBW3053529.1 hypothetical protein [Prochlorococcus marinus str. MU1410]